MMGLCDWLRKRKKPSEERSEPVSEHVTPPHGTRLQEPSGNLIYHGKPHPVEFKVVQWSDPNGYEFNGKPRNRDPDVFVLHWDVCPSAEICASVLSDRGLSIHFLIDGDEDATVYQCMDLDQIAQHASPINYRSVGVEINNPVLPPSPTRPLATNQSKPNSSERWDHLDFYPAQKRKAVQLCEAVCDVLGISRHFPTSDVKLDAALIADCVCGHYHVSEEKIDPGLTLWPELESAGFGAVVF